MSLSVLRLRAGNASRRWKPAFWIVLGLSVALLVGCQQAQPGEERREEIVQDSGTVDSLVPKEGTREQSRDIDEPARDQSDAGLVETDPPEVIIKQAVLKVETVVPVKKSLSQWRLPTSLQKARSLSVHLLSDLTALLGGSEGLYQVRTDKITRVADAKVVGLADWRKDIPVVATAKTLYRFEGDLQSTQLADSLESSPILALASSKNDSFWIGTQASLWLLEKDTLQQFVDFKGATRLQSQRGKDALYGIDLKRQPFSLQKNAGGAWSLVFFNKEKEDLVQVLPANKEHTHFWGLDKNGHLWLRKLDGQEAAWWPFRIKPDQDDNPTLVWKELLLQPDTGAVWAWDGKKGLLRLGEKSVAELSMPKEVTDLLWVRVSSDGALWMSDGVRLVRLGDAGPVVTYKGQIQPLLTKHCTRCHKSSGVGKRFLLDTYENAKKHSARALEQVSKGLMPPGKPLGKAESELLQKWIAGGNQP